MDLLTGALLSTATEASTSLTFDVSLETFHRIVDRAGECLVVHVDQYGKGKRHFYLMAHGGYHFVTKADHPMTFGSQVEVIDATRMIEDVPTYVNSRWS